MENNLEVKKENLTAIEIRAQVNLIQSVMAEVMKINVHYGKVPGCGDKPTLLKPGAEKIMATFMLSADPMIDDLSTDDVIRYRLTVKMLTREGKFLGAGVGEASSEEEKYRWRKVVCDEEFEATPEDRRREKWIKDYRTGKASTIKQIMTNKADIANTILKMAKKRALVDGVLTVTAASDIFAQDLEDMPAEILNQDAPVANGKPAVEMPKEKAPAAQAPAPQAPAPTSKANNPISEPQRKRLYAISKSAGYTEEDVKNYLMENLGIESTKDIEREHYEDICTIFQTPKAKDE
jgi:hypothetical protein